MKPLKGSSSEELSWEPIPGDTLQGTPYRGPLPGDQVQGNPSRGPRTAYPLQGTPPTGTLLGAHQQGVPTEDPPQRTHPTGDPAGYLLQETTYREHPTSASHTGPLQGPP